MKGKLGFLFCFLVEMTDCFPVLNSLVKEWSYLPCIVLWAVKFYGYICKTVLLYFMSNWKIYFFTIVPVEIQAILQEKPSKTIKRISVCFWVFVFRLCGHPGFIRTFTRKLIQKQTWFLYLSFLLFYIPHSADILKSGYSKPP